MSARRHLTMVFAAALLAVMAPRAASAQQGAKVAAASVIVSSGLAGHLRNAYQKAGGKVSFVPATAGRALAMARGGQVDVIYISDLAGEKRLQVEGHGRARRDVMYSELVVIGPKRDPAAIKGMTSIIHALRTIAGKGARFVSRGDDGGTHRAERRIWSEAGIDLAAGAGKWYRAAENGARETVRLAARRGAYTLVERWAWKADRGRPRLILAVEGDPRLIQQYSVILVNPAKHPGVSRAAGMKFIRWITSKRGQKSINSFRIGTSQPYFADYEPPEPEAPAKPKKSKKGKGKKRAR